MVLNLDQYLNEELGETSVKVKKILDEVIPQKKPDILYEASRHLIIAGGKMLRPYVVIKSCEAVGGDEDTALPAAAAIELLHTFTLIHDDIMDNGKVRRGVSAVHVQWDIPTAIMAGDLLFAKVYKTLVEGLGRKKILSERIVKATGVIAEAAITICEGQMLDMSFSKLEKVLEEEYLVMVEKKTSSLFKTSAEVGALVGGGTDWQIEKLGCYAKFMGTAFQIVDDVLGLEAEEKELGKPVGSDLKEGKKTLPVIFALQQANKSQKKTILNAMKKTSTKKEILEAKKVIEELGGVDYSMKKAEQFVEQALKQLEPLPQTKAKESLTTLTKFVIKRKF